MEIVSRRQSVLENIAKTASIRLEQITKANHAASRAMRAIDEASAFPRRLSSTITIATNALVAAQQKHAQEMKAFDAISAQHLRQSATIANALGSAFLPRANVIEALAAEVARVVEPIRVVADSMSAWETRLNVRMAAIKTPWALHNRLKQSVIGFARLSRLSDAVHATRPFSAPVRKLVADELGAGVETHPDQTASERDEKAVKAGLNPDLIAFPPDSFGEVVFAAGFELRLTPMAVPQAIESPDSSAGFDPQPWRIITKLEQRLRHIVQEHLRGLDGENWVKRRVPEKMRNRWLERQHEERNAGRPVYEPIQYADFMDLADIIGRRDNWNDAFKPIFRNRDDFMVSLRRLHPIRKAIGHSRPVGRADVLILLSEAVRIFRALGMQSLN